MCALQLGVLDLCKRSPGMTAGAALHGTLALAEAVDGLGFSRYWVAEHHVEDTAEACPEVLIPLIAARTQRLRVGSGGVLLRYYSPLKVAETFLTLEALFPGRIELGVCKGPGVVHPAVADALVGGNAWELGDDAFDRKVFELQRYLAHCVPAQAGAAESPRARPYGVPPPPVWVLGSGSKSATLASELDLSYACALMFARGVDLGPRLLQQHRQQARSAARGLIAVSMVCMSTEAEAHAIERDLSGEGLLPSTIVGAPEQCAARLGELASRAGTDEILIATWARDPALRLGMYRLIAEATRA